MDSNPAGDAKNLPARRQHPDTGTLRQDGRGDPRSLVDDASASVQHQQRVRIPESRDDTGKRVRAASIHGTCDEIGDDGRVGGLAKINQPDSVGDLSLERARDLERQTALPDARWPGKRHEPVFAQQLDDARELFLAVDERRWRRGQVAAARRDCDRGDRRVMSEDRLLQPPQLRPRLQPQLLLQHPPRLLKALERVRLPAAPVEREHQLRPQPLSERILLDGGTELRHDLAMLAERERRLELLLESIDSQRLQPPRLAAEPRRLGQPLQRRTAPEAERQRNGLRRAAGIALAQRNARLA